MVQLPEPWPPNPWPTRFRTVRASDPELTEPGLRFVTVNSPALGGRGDVVVYQPPSSPADGPDQAHTDIPVVLLLHGVYGSAWNWSLNGAAHLTAADLIRRERIGPVVLVMPSDGMVGEGTAYLPTPPADFERWVAVDAVAAAMELVDGVTARSPLFVGGLSMGAFGAARVASSLAGRVAGVAMHSPITHLDQLALFTEVDIGEASAIDDSERDVLSYVDPSRPRPLLIDCGRSDPLLPSVRALHRALDSSAVPHVYEEYDGDHNWASWRARIGRSLVFFDQVAQGRVAS